MATDLENLRTARSNILAALAQHGHKATYTIEGQSVSRDSLFERLEKLNTLIAAEDVFELETEAYT